MNLIDIKKKSTFLFRGISNTILLNTIYKRQYDLKDTLIIAGTTRSGSTWLAEIVSAHPEAGQIFEPLSPTNVREARKCGFTFNTFLEPGSQWPAGKVYLDKVLRGQVLTPWTTSQIPVCKAKNIRFLVIKFVRANLLLGWLARNFPVRPPALIIRHPCAIVASESRRFPLPNIDALLKSQFFNKYPYLKERCKDLSLPEEARALKWCMRYYASLALPAPYPFVLITYEALVRRGEEELGRLYKKWGMSVSQEALARLDRPSRTVSGESQIVRGKDPLTGWKKHLTRQEISNILKVVDLFDLNFYTEDVEPNYARLLQPGNILSSESLPG